MTTFNDPRLGASLDNPSLADRVINLSRELAVANGALEQANDKIGLLTLAKNDMDQALETATSRYSLYKNAQTTLHNRIDLASATIKHAIINDDIDKDTLIQIASDLQVELTREVRVKMTITASGTATVPIGFNLDEIDTEISVEFSNNYGDLELDIDVDDMTVDCEDI
jgi:prefoldin subunit 5